ncbi:MAG: ATPase [Candidatus Edwardsbacteria bacterium RIFOXYD12_FULL_50_11]|uniref:ATPase n=1 Tax=Candidatus Edwardsbacteria bacterium GWF2_54_11 TaxID=1817851 RepID=A0A1F5RF82_9BACT|nr:MAG: ATPase [Candidatus Edwardsbacteria bacterium RifOxyC12_full_54_24]OGF07088.1 MAG: ATPase [Candidatus Edwardsbacteria bacterium RifOxyA12_full_54_48]OGF10947.1 MAG: ATPase [Candidatus Edwardsbacteria bacterium GWE2_54_12]OGF13135.1 MAG: ATPase [Candidatus Edwardsbacteria bacterium GWF2_54_11]OGF15892.1 MAG: ATPase [Candidatus Edwardsbacteria bacterium RIFOXYD12_FULL_50_11]OGJ17441.1 MAG: ATPase [Candidatus Edwardsbacteria bacterium RifOxyB12_full_52_30]HAD82123.1 ATPase [Candidatus Edw
MENHSDQIKRINEEIEKKSIIIQTITAEIGKAIVGQNYLVSRLLVGLLANGHILIEGVPGLAKTYAVRTVSSAIKAKFQRIQFTPDLLPADIIGTMIYNQKTGEFITSKGPIFANLILADEINRTPPKVQSALLEAMQERQITIGEQTFKLDDPFLVLATQNPIEQEGTYPLPEAQLDRFLLKIKIDYPSKEEEKEIVERIAVQGEPSIKPVITPAEIIKARELCQEIYIDQKIKDYIIDLIFATREPEKYGLPELKGMIRFGASPRASINLTTTARALAFLKRRGFVIPEDIKELAADILRHRIILSYEAEAEDITTDDIIQKILAGVEVP